MFRIVRVNCANEVFLLLTAKNGVVLATEKKHKSILYDEHSIHKIETISRNIGMVYSGMGPDYRFVHEQLLLLYKLLVLIEI